MTGTRAQLTIRCVILSETTYSNRTASDAKESGGRGWWVRRLASRSRRDRGNLTE
jgi:hypothetical protein